jgi:hypothetical protein
MEAMEDKKPEAGTEASEKEKKQTEQMGAAVLLAFPSHPSDPTPQLAPLRDNRSAYIAVAKACLHLNQFALNGSSSTMDDTHSVASSALFHDASLAASFSGAFSSLMECLQTHEDRRAKILCAKTLAVVARATYARLRHSPQLFALRENNRLEDEVGTDVPVALCTAALEDPDDGVAASSIHALGMLILASSSTPGTLVEDELLRELLAIVQGRMAPYAPTLHELQDEDAHIPQMELQTRIFENVLSPRLLQLVCRVMAFESPQHSGMILPVLTASVVYLSKTAMTYGMDRTTYAKRWVELDFVTLVNDVVEVILLPAMQSSCDGHLAYAAALSSIRLLHACPHAPWVHQVSYWAILVLKEEFSLVESVEAKLTTLASLLICARAVPLPERYTTLAFCFEKFRDLPSTTIAPHGIHSSGLLFESRGLCHYRRPARVPLLAELALSFFLDGPVESKVSNIRSSALGEFLRSADLISAFKEVQNGKVTQLREELVTAFSMVAVGVGRRHRNHPDGGTSAHLMVTASPEQFTEWIHMSLLVLDAFSSCITWNSGSSSPSYLEEDLSLLVAAQATYVLLVQEVLHAAGLLQGICVSLKMVPTASPPNMLWDQMEESAAFLGHYENTAAVSSTAMLDRVSKLMDTFIKKELKGSGIVSHHTRLYLLSLAADQWVQARYLATRKEFEGSSDGKASMNANSASDLLLALSPRRVFSKVVESHKSQVENYGKKKKELYKKYAQETVTVCVACIENIALAACDWRKRFGNSADTKNIFNLASCRCKEIVQEMTQILRLPCCQSAKGPSNGFKRLFQVTIK